MSLYSVQAVLKKDKENEAVRDRPRSGPPPSTTPREYWYVFIPLSLNNRRATSKILKRDCECEEAS